MMPTQPPQGPAGANGSSDTMSVYSVGGYGAVHGTAHVNRIQLITLQLRSLCNSSPDFTGAAVLTTDGFIVSSLLPETVSEEILSGLSAALLGAGDNLAEQLLRTETRRILVQTVHGHIIVNAVDQQAVLILLATEKARLGYVFLELERTALSLAEIMQ